ncbi:LamB/YcsF family protein [Gordonia sp. PDNC005]|uniref:LamB/YcsF family protein n=1 Tax=unclassified Gordonia (in: high G+C Gram-positive bacteria) TaxID=2657482 RepID=UPI001964F3CE|nr:5-oxoprolinase subunit PxpA [Gordonia sp. PDNC005]QRY61798.1 LamB/YcsF family protein [Gordonia sp. PDNC005]
MPRLWIDLNADLGEGVGDDSAMMPLISSANIACGFHAGTPTVLLNSCREAVRFDVRIGAQVSYPDLAGFGRRFIDVAPEDLIADVLYQVGALTALASTVGGRVAYVKPHGALYNTVVHHEAQARALVEAVRRTGLELMCLPGSAAQRFAREAAVPVIIEAFADRGYTPEGTLVPRSEPGALLTDSDEIAARVVDLARTGRITAVDGTVVDAEADSVCLHGDTPGAVEHARAVRTALADAGVDVAAR